MRLIHEALQPATGPSHLVHWRTSFAPIVGVAVLILLLAPLIHNLPAEGDGFLKANTILRIIEQGQWFDLTRGRGYFVLNYSFFYLASALATLFMGEARVFLAMDLVSVLSSGLLFFFAALTLKRCFDAPAWLTLFLFLSMPVIVRLATFGNEEILAVSFLMAAMYFAAGQTLVYASIAGGLFTLAVFSRADMLFMGPALLVSMIALSPRPTPPIGRLAVLTGTMIATSALTAGLYFLVFLRDLESVSAFWRFRFHPLLLATFLSYPFCISIVLICLIAAFFARREWPSLLLFAAAVAVPLLVYYGMQTYSPKHFLPLAIVALAFSTFLYMKASRLGRILLVIAILPWWIVSLTPLGARIADGAYWGVPSVDGSFATGDYLGTWFAMRQGIFRERRQTQAKVYSDLEALVRQTPHDVFLITREARSIVPYVMRPEPPANLLFDRSLAAPDDPNAVQVPAPTLLITDADYTRLRHFEKATYAFLKSCVDSGAVQARIGVDSPIPSVVEICTVPPGSDTQLAARMAFAEETSLSGGWVSMSRFIEAFGAVCWLPIGDAPKDVTPLYQDSSFAAFDRFYEDCKIMSNWYARAYYSMKRPLNEGGNRQ